MNNFVGLNISLCPYRYPKCRGTTAGKILPRFWVSIRSYKKQPVKKNWGRILDLACLKFAVAALYFVTEPKLLIYPLHQLKPKTKTKN